jgi:sugar phosphate isomerase/epimerase
VDRRDFLGTLAGGLAVVPAVGCGGAGESPAQSGSGTTAGPSRRLERIGLQLYTVRSELEKNVEGTLERVARAGFKEVELDEYFGKTAKQMRAILDRHGLTAPAGHVEYEELGAGWAKVIDDAKIIGHEYLVIPFLEEELRAQPDAYSQVAAALAKGAEATNKAGLKFAYHNHQFEFAPVKDGMTGFDVLVAESSPAVLFELDVFWAAVAGQDPVALLGAHGGRIPLIHIKDMRQRPERLASEPFVPSERAFTQMVDVGMGSIDWAAVLARAEQAGVRHYFVEHDRPASAFESIQASYRYLDGLRF